MPAVREKFNLEMENNVLLIDVCRLCAENYDSRSFIPLFTEDKRERIIAKQINQLVVNLVSPDDGLPHKICLKCSKNVELCYSFVCNVIETQNKLKRLKRVADQKLKRMSDNEFAENYRSYSRLKYEEMNTSAVRNSCHDDSVGPDDDRECNAAVVDDFIELLVVHPEEMVEVDVNGVLVEQQPQSQQQTQRLQPQHQQQRLQNKLIGDDMVAVVDEVARSPLPSASLSLSAGYSTSIGSKKEREEKKENYRTDDVTLMESLGNVVPSVGLRKRPSPAQTQTLLVIDSKNYNDDNGGGGGGGGGVDDDDDDAVFAAIKDEPKEMLFCDDYDDEILELQEEQQVTWVYDDSLKDKAICEEECDIVYKCGSCANTYENEALFQSHNCVGEYEGHEIVVQMRRDDDDDDDDEGIRDDGGGGGGGDNNVVVDDVNKGRSFFQCDVCDRIFKSKLVFKLHYAQHKKSNVCQLCFLEVQDLQTHLNQAHSGVNCDSEDGAMYEEALANSEKQCDVCGKITDNLKQHKLYHAVKELEFCKAENKKFLKKWFYCQKCNKKIFSEANYLFHVAKHNGEDTVSCRQCNFVAVNIQDYNMHITTHTGGKYFICNDCEKCFFTRSAISDHVLIHMDGTRYMCEICGKRFKTSRSNAQHKLLQHKKYFRCNRCNRGFTHEAKLKSHYNICRVINQDQKESKVFEPVEKFFCNICNSNIKSSSEISILFHKAKHEGKDGVECKFCNLLCKNACMYKNHLLIHTNQRPYACTQCPKSFRTKGCLVQHMLVHGDEYKYTCEYCGKKSKKLTTHVNHVNIHTGTKPYKCPDCDRPFRQLSDMKKHRRTHLKYKTEPSAATAAAAASVTVTTELPYLTIKTEVEDMIAAESIQQLQLA